MAKLRDAALLCNSCWSSGQNSKNSKTQWLTLSDWVYFLDSKTTVVFWLQVVSLFVLTNSLDFKTVTGHNIYICGILILCFNILFFSKIFVSSNGYWIIAGYDEKVPSSFNMFKNFVKSLKSSFENSTFRAWFWQN